MGLHALASGAIFGSGADVNHVDIPHATILAADQITNPIGTPSSSSVAHANIEPAVQSHITIPQSRGEDTTFTIQTETSRPFVITPGPGGDPKPQSSQAPSSGVFDYSSCNSTSRITIETVPPTASEKIVTGGGASAASNVPSTKDHYTTTYDISKGNTVRPTSTADKQITTAVSLNDAECSSNEALQASDISHTDERTPIMGRVINSSSQATPTTMPGIFGDPRTTNDPPRGTTKPPDERPGTTLENPHPPAAATIRVPVDVITSGAVPTGCERPNVTKRDDGTASPESTRTCERPSTSERGESSELSARETSTALSDGLHDK